MKFKTISKEPEVSLESLEALASKMETYKFEDVNQELCEDLTHLMYNIEMYGLTDQIKDLVGGTLEEYGISIESKEASLEGIMDTVKKAGKAAWEAIKAAIKKIIDFVKGFFSKHKEISKDAKLIDDAEVPKNVVQPGVASNEANENEAVYKFKDAIFPGVFLKKKDLEEMIKQCEEAWGDLENLAGTANFVMKDPNPAGTESFKKATEAFSEKYDSLFDAKYDEKKVAFGDLGFQTYRECARLIDDALMFQRRADVTLEKISKISDNIDKAAADQKNSTSEKFKTAEANVDDRAGMWRAANSRMNFFRSLVSSTIFVTTMSVKQCVGIDRLAARIQAYAKAHENDRK